MKKAGIGATVGCLFVLCWTSTASSQGYFVESTASKRATAGRVMTVTALPKPFYGAPRRLHRCQTSVIGPSNERVCGPAKRTRTGAVARWRIRLPLVGTEGSWRAVVRCTGASSTSSSTEVKAAVRKPTLTGLQWRNLSGERWAWAARMTNSSSAYSIESAQVTATFRDVAGRFITSSSTGEMIVPRRSGGWVGGELQIEGETPASVTVSARGRPTASRIVPFIVRDARLVFTPETESRWTQFIARAEYQNMNSLTVEAGRVFVVAFDPAGALVRAAWEFDLVALSPGAARGFEYDLGSAGARPDASAQIYPSLYAVSP